MAGMAIKQPKASPCPFCGSPNPAAWSGDVRRTGPGGDPDPIAADIYCSECSAHGPRVQGPDEASAKAAAVEAWNKRQPAG
jgi:hypothetical protein